MNGTMLISDSEDCVDLDICGIAFVRGQAGRAAERSGKCLFDLRGDFQRKGVKPLRKVANILQKLIIENYRRDGDKKARGSGQQGFRDARRDGAQDWRRRRSPRPENASMMPQTVPKSPMNGETEPVVASQDIPFSARRTSSADATCIFAVTACKLLSFGGCGLPGPEPTWLCSSR